MAMKMATNKGLDETEPLSENAIFLDEFLKGFNLSFQGLMDKQKEYERGTTPSTGGYH